VFWFVNLDSLFISAALTTEVQASLSQECGWVIAVKWEIIPECVCLHLSPLPIQPIFTCRMCGQVHRSVWQYDSSIDGYSYLKGWADLFLFSFRSIFQVFLIKRLFKNENQAVWKVMTYPVGSPPTSTLLFLYCAEFSLAFCKLIVCVVCIHAYICYFRMEGFFNLPTGTASLSELLFYHASRSSGNLLSPGWCVISNPLYAPFSFGI